LEALRRELKLLKGWVEANTRRIEELEATAFQLEDAEEILLVTIPQAKEGKKPG
jgi:hypothetical protein